MRRQPTCSIRAQPHHKTPYVAAPASQPRRLTPPRPPSSLRRPLPPARNPTSPARYPPHSTSSRHAVDTTDAGGSPPSRLSAQLRSRDRLLSARMPAPNCPLAAPFRGRGRSVVTPPISLHLGTLRFSRRLASSRAAASHGGIALLPARLHCDDGLTTRAKRARRDAAWS